MLYHLPPSLIFRPRWWLPVESEAARQAKEVVEFLDALGTGAIPPQKRTRRFFLLLGAALHLRWESQGFFFHREAGLPDADQAIREAMSLPHSAADPTPLGIAILRLFLEQFAWNGPHNLDADVALDNLTDDAAVLDALAEYLWATRHAGVVADRPSREPFMLKRPERGPTAPLYTRDSGGEHETTPGEYVRWARAGPPGLASPSRARPNRSRP